MPEASEAAGAPGGGADVEQEYEIRNDEGFVYKVPIGLYPDAATSSTQPAAVPDPRAAGLRRRRRALLRLRAKRLRDLSRWEALTSELLAPLPAPQPPASLAAASSHPVTVASSSSHPVAAAAAASSSSHPVAAAASSSSVSILDDLLAQVDAQTETMKTARQWCDEINALCDAREAATVDSIAALPLWGANPSELMAGLYSPDEKGKKAVKEPTMSHGLAPPILTESRTRKRVTDHSGSNNIASPAPVKPKRKKASESTSTASGTPGPMTRRKVASTPTRAPDIVCSPGPLTRRRAAAPKVSPGGSLSTR